MSSSPGKLLIGTHNAGKVLEFRDMLASAGVEVSGLGAFPNVDEVDEIGSTFEENARLKAVAYARQTGLATLADDSGLEVACLDGRPGVLSARYGGANISFDEKIRLLLAEVDHAKNGRKARFVCSIIVADPNGDLLAETEGICGGELATSPRGDLGFGYDPIFIPDGYDRTFGELTGAEKARISHRGRAFSQIMPFLRGFYGIST